MFYKGRGSSCTAHMYSKSDDVHSMAGLMFTAVGGNTFEPANGAAGWCRLPNIQLEGDVSGLVGW